MAWVRRATSISRSRSPVGSPAEEDGRVTHLAALKARHWSGHDFGFCDDIASGFAQGECAAHAKALADAKRKQEFAGLTEGWSEPEQRAFADLHKAAAGFVEARADNEVDISGTARGALVTGEKEDLKQEFLATLQRLAAGTAPSLTTAKFRAADAELNLVYRRVQQADGKDWGTVTTDGIRTAQRAWLRYRDAWVAFAKIKYPSVAPDSLRAWLTQKRTAELNAFLS